MIHDFARQSRNDPTQAPPPRRWRWFAFGLLCGLAISFFPALWPVDPAPGPAVTANEAPEEQPAAAAEEIQWDFFEIFPKSVVPVLEEYANSAEPVAAEDALWILQAGSFRRASDADERRASLILMGLDATTNKVDLAGTTWHRVIVGPFDSELARNRAQDRLAQAEISAMAMQVPRH